MASSKRVLLLAAAAVAAVACLASLASATPWVVGDECGWKKDFDQTWANGKTFVVGDTLLFNYEEGKHSVVQVSEADFNACNKDGNQLGAWCSGNDVVTLDRPGKAFFICTKGKHCEKGMKLAIDVVNPAFVGAPPPPVFQFPFPGMAPPPPPPPPPPVYSGWPYPGTGLPPPSLLAPPPRSAAVRNPVGGAVAVAVVVSAAAAALTF